MCIAQLHAQAHTIVSWRILTFGISHICKHFLTNEIRQFANVLFQESLCYMVCRTAWKLIQPLCKDLLVKMRATTIDKNKWVCYYTLLQLCNMHYIKFQVKNSKRSASVITKNCTAYRHLCGSRERNGTRRRTKVTQALKLLRRWRKEGFYKVCETH